MRQAKLFTGLKSLLDGSPEYQYSYSPTISYNCTIRSLFQPQLQHKYPSPTLQQLTTEYYQHMNLPTELLGKRSSQIIVSANRKYCFKLIDDDSLRKIMEIMGDVLQYEQNNPTTYIIDIYRIFVVQSLKDNYRQVDAYILMPCLRPNFEDILAVYDLKGHTEARNLSPKDFKIFKFGKDQNFINSKQLELIRKISVEEREKFVSNFVRDTNFLLEKKVIDYSLLLSFRLINENGSNELFKNSLKISENMVMQWAIIDFFQQYNQKKKAENRIKTLFRKQVSSVEPELYSQRLAKFVQKYFLA